MSLIRDATDVVMAGDLNVSVTVAAERGRERQDGTERFDLPLLSMKADRAAAQIVPASPLAAATMALYLARSLPPDPNGGPLCVLVFQLPPAPESDT